MFICLIACFLVEDNGTIVSIEILNEAGTHHLNSSQSPGSIATQLLHAVIKQSIMQNCSSARFCGIKQLTQLI